MEKQQEIYISEEESIIKIVMTPKRMRKHIENEHRDDCSNCDYEWKVISKFKKPMLRQLGEAVHINNTKKMNL